MSSLPTWLAPAADFGVLRWLRGVCQVERPLGFDPAAPRLEYLSRRQPSSPGPRAGNLAQPGSSPFRRARIRARLRQGTPSSRSVIYVVHALRSRRVGDQLPVSRRQVTMATPEHLVAADAAAPDRAVRGPALRRDEPGLRPDARHPPVMRGERQIDRRPSVSALAKRSQAEATQPKPSMIQASRHNRLGMRLQVLFARNLATAGPELVMSKRYSGSRVRSAMRRASVDFPPPALPKTATFLMRYTQLHGPRARPDTSHRLARCAGVPLIGSRTVASTVRLKLAPSALNGS